MAPRAFEELLSSQFRSKTFRCFIPGHQRRDQLHRRRSGSRPTPGTRVSVQPKFFRRRISDPDPELCARPPHQLRAADERRRRLYHRRPHAELELLAGIVL